MFIDKTRESYEGRDIDLEFSNAISEINADPNYMPIIMFDVNARGFSMQDVRKEYSFLDDDAMGPLSVF